MSHFRSRRHANERCIIYIYIYIRGRKEEAVIRNRIISKDTRKRSLIKYVCASLPLFLRASFFFFRERRRRRRRRRRRHHRLLLNYFGCQPDSYLQTGGMFAHIMTTDSRCQAGYAFQFVSGNNNNYSSRKSSLPYSMNLFFFPLPLSSSCIFFPQNPWPRRQSFGGRAIGRTIAAGKNNSTRCIPFGIWF